MAGARFAFRRRRICLQSKRFFSPQRNFISGGAATSFVSCYLIRCFSIHSVLFLTFDRINCLLALFSMKRACRRMKLRLRRYEEMKRASTAHERQERASLFRRRRICLQSKRFISPQRNFISGEATTLFVACYLIRFPSSHSFLVLT